MVYKIKSKCIFTRGFPAGNPAMRLRRTALYINVMPYLQKKMKKIILYLLILPFLNSCYVVNHKKNVINLNDSGDKLHPINTNGYYYQEKEKMAYPYFKNHYGGFSQDSTRQYQQKVIVPLILNKNGTVRTFGYSNGFQENRVFDYATECGLLDINTFENAKKHFECDIVNDENRLMIWGKGVFKTEDSKILVQYYVNWIGNYYLIEKKGKILNDSTFILTESFDYKLNEKNSINELYKFEYYKNKPDSTSLITKHPKRFGRKTRHNKTYK